MPEPAIKAAIIGAISTAAMTAASEVSKSVRAAGGSAIGATITNKSAHDYLVRAYPPNHGHFIQSPAVILPGYFYEYRKFISAVKAEYGNNYSDKDVLEEIENWSGKNLFDIYAKGTTTKYEGVGSGMGFESAILLSSEGSVSLQVAILIRKIPGGSYGVGLGVANHDFYSDRKNNYYGGFIIDHIKHIHTKHCQYSDGGRSISVTVGDIKVTASAPGEVNLITIEEA